MDEHAILYNVPRPRQEWIDGKFVKKSEETEEAWVALFIDLVYVVLLSKLGALLYYCTPSVFLYWKLSVYFWSLCLTRHAIDEYANRFYSPDLLHKVIYLVYTVGVIIQVLNINHSSPAGDIHGCDFVSEFGLGMVVGILITRISIITIYSVVMANDKIARTQFMFDIVRWSITSFLMGVRIVLAAGGFESGELDLIIIGTSVLQEVAIWILARAFFRHYFLYPVDLEALQARWGIWIMIVIGESIIQMLAIPLSLDKLWDTYFLTVVAVVLMFSLGMQYYDACHVEWYNHALTKSAMAGVSWIWLHVPMSYHLFRVGAGLETLFHDMHDSRETDDLFVATFSVSLGVVTLVLTLIRQTNNNFEGLSEPFDLVKFVSRLLLSGLQISVIWWGLRRPIDVLLVHACISVCGFNALDVIYDLLLVYLDEVYFYEEELKELTGEEFVEISSENNNSNSVNSHSISPKPSSKSGVASSKTVDSVKSVGRSKKNWGSSKSVASNKSASSSKLAKIEELKRTPKQWSAMHLTKSEFNLHQVEEGDEEGKLGTLSSALTKLQMSNSRIEEEEEHDLEPSSPENKVSTDPAVEDEAGDLVQNLLVDENGQSSKSNRSTGNKNMSSSASNHEGDLEVVSVDGMSTKRGRVHPVLTRHQHQHQHPQNQPVEKKKLSTRMSAKRPISMKSRGTYDAGNVEMSYDGFVFTVNNEQNNDTFFRKKQTSDISFRRVNSSKEENGSSLSSKNTAMAAMADFGRRTGNSGRRFSPDNTTPSLSSKIQGRSARIGQLELSDLGQQLEEA